MATRRDSLRISATGYDDRDPRELAGTAPTSERPAKPGRPGDLYGRATGLERPRFAPTWCPVGGLLRLQSAPKPVSDRQVTSFNCR